MPPCVRACVNACVNCVCVRVHGKTHRNAGGVSADRTLQSVRALQVRRGMEATRGGSYGYYSRFWSRTRSRQSFAKWSVGVTSERAKG
jgi:hypothetical protein